MRLKNWDKGGFTEPSTSFAPNTYKLYILRHCINIVFILQKNHIPPSTFNFLINYPLIIPFDIFCQQEIVKHVIGVPDKAIFRSVTEYNKDFSSQCNLSAQIEQMQDIKLISR